MIQLLSIMEGAPTGAVATCKKLMPDGHIIDFFNSVMSHILFYFYLNLIFFNYKWIKINFILFFIGS